MAEATVALANARGYEQRLGRYMTAMDLGRPERVPVWLLLGEVQATYAGIPRQEVFYDFDRNLTAARFVAERLDLDFSPGVARDYWAPLMDAVGAVYYRFPGKDLPPDGHFQFVEGEYMLPEDYEPFIASPTEWILSTYLPRIQKEFRQPGSLRGNLALIRGMAATAKLASKNREFDDVLAREYGLPPLTSGKAYAPFDVLGDKLRGMRGILLDIHRRPDQVLRAADALVDHVIYKIMASGGSTALPAFMPLHRGAYPFLSPKQWRTFYWPSLKRVVEALWSLGKRTMFFAEGDWTLYLESITELPPRSIVFHADQTDLATAKRLFKGHYCLSGNVPGDVLAYGSPGDVREYTKRLVGDYAGDGGFLVAPGALINDPVPIENVEALLEAAHERVGAPVSRESPGKGGQPNAGSVTGLAAAPRVEGPGRPGVCLPWTTLKPEMGEVLGDEGLVRREWEDVDGLAYAYLWSWIA